ncbi:glyoxalase/bleomycin resistance/extradiol dioxygenase family protein [Cesiribacter sp. SM1]|uniref:VOC family protein n=1 Tax=Cesiribacter sp. SM1 TaxID=2861196 RepID=UPI001CD23320|nr:VOC family protein [Cesiribacter sp. SM1]
MKIPAQYLPLMPYLILKNAKAFSDFAKTVFGAKEQLTVPAADGSIMHAELKIHDAVIMLAQAGDNWSEKTAGMYIYVEDVDSVYHAAINGGAQSLMEPQKKDYGYTAGFNDPFGNQWWIVAAE